MEFPLSINAALAMIAGTVLAGCAVYWIYACRRCRATMTKIAPPTRYSVITIFALASGLLGVLIYTKLSTPAPVPSYYDRVTGLRDQVSKASSEIESVLKELEQIRAYETEMATKTGEQLRELQQGENVLRERIEALKTAEPDAIRYLAKPAGATAGPWKSLALVLAGVAIFAVASLVFRQR